MEGVVSKEIIALQQQFLIVHGSETGLTKWSTGLITGLLEIVYGQWLY